MQRAVRDLYKIRPLDVALDASRYAQRFLQHNQRFTDMVDMVAGGTRGVVRKGEDLERDQLQQGKNLSQKRKRTYEPAPLQKGSTCGLRVRDSMSSHVEGSATEILKHRGLN